MDIYKHKTEFLHSGFAIRSASASAAAFFAAHLQSLPIPPSVSCCQVMMIVVQLGRSPSSLHLPCQKCKMGRWPLYFFTVLMKQGLVTHVGPKYWLFWLRMQTLTPKCAFRASRRVLCFLRCIQFLAQGLTLHVCYWLNNLSNINQRTRITRARS